MAFLYRCASSLKSGHCHLLCSALIGSTIKYCCSAWYPSLLAEFRNHLAVLQRKMVRFVRDADRREHVEEADVWDLGWMPFQKRARFFMAMHVFKIRWSTAPAYISENFQLISRTHSHGIRQSESNFSLSRCTFPVKSFTHNAIVLWNSLPSQLKATESYNVFKKGLTAFLKHD